MVIGAVEGLVEVDQIEGRNILFPLDDVDALVDDRDDAYRLGAPVLQAMEYNYRRRAGCGLRSGHNYDVRPRPWVRYLGGSLSVKRYCRGIQDNLYIEAALGKRQFYRPKLLPADLRSSQAWTTRLAILPRALANQARGS